MGNRRLGALTLFVLGAAAVAASPASALQTQTFVESTGENAGQCMRTAPCRTFEFALKRTSAGGEIVALDTANFGNSLTIDRAVTITATRGARADMTGSSGDLITINAGAGAEVALERLDLLGRGASNGVVINSGEVTLDDVTVRRFAQDGLHANASTDALTIVDSRLSRNSDDGAEIFGAATTPRRKVLVKDSRVSGSFFGISMAGGVAGVVDGTSVSRTTIGIEAFGGGSDRVTGIVVRESDITNNSAFAMQAESNGLNGNSVTIYVGRSLIAFNTGAFSGNVFSFGNNEVAGNGGSTTPVGVIPPV